MEAAHIPWWPLGRLLVEKGLLSEVELEHALEHQAATGRRLGETLVELGYLSGTTLSRALAAQYGIELATESGFGTGLRAEIERRQGGESQWEIEPRPPGPDPSRTLTLVPEPQPSEAEAVAEEIPYLAQLEEQWAKLAAAEERLAEVEAELARLRMTDRRRRGQISRLIERVRKRDQRIAELSRVELSEPVTTSSVPAAESERSYLILVQLAERYELVERDGVPPQPNARLELPEIGDGTWLVSKLGTSPLPNDKRPCAFAEQVHTPRA